MELRIAYWNINKKNCEEIASFIVDLIKEKDLDVLLLSEFENLDKNELSNLIPDEYSMIKTSGSCKKILAFVKCTNNYHLLTEGIRHLILYCKPFDLAIVGLHLSDRRNHPDSIKRIQELNDVLESIKRVGCKNYIFVGDFNCSPFDMELIYSEGMHAVLFKKEMKTTGEGKAKHYNPMLFVLNEQKGSYGSYRYIHNEYPLYWYAFDQVIVSETLMNNISNIEFLKSIKGKTLMSGCGLKPVISDHLPLIFKIGDEYD